jgi:tetratricopeptide (TPR) repeat protein
MKWWVLIFLLSFCSVGRAEVDLRSIWENRKGIALLKEQKPEEALAHFSDALVHSPDSAEIHLNMGLAFEAAGQPDKALQSYQTAEKLATSHEMQFMARFNRGALLQKAKRTDEALDAYHAALEVAPESRETKINIELLIQQQQQQGGQGQNQQQQGDNKDQKDGGQGDKKKEDQPKQYAKNKPQPRPFKSEELTQGDVNKILGELRNQEQRIRSEYNKREVKERPRGKDW